MASKAEQKRVRAMLRQLSRQAADYASQAEGRDQFTEAIAWRLTSAVVDHISSWTGLAVQLNMFELDG